MTSRELEDELDWRENQGRGDDSFWLILVAKLAMLALSLWLEY